MRVCGKDENMEQKLAPAKPLPLTAPIPQPSPLEGDRRHWLIDAAEREIRAAWTQRSEGLKRKSEAQGYNYALGPQPLQPHGGVIHIGDRKISVLMDLALPRIVHYSNLLSQAECEANTHNELDRMTLHGGAPVLQGNKWIMTKWMRQEKFE